MNKLFEFKLFSINQSITAMKIGLDGIILGAWTPCENATRILDIGTGTGLIALMIAQRSHALIDAIEIEPNAYKQAEENFNKSPWSDRLHAINSDFKTWQPNQTYDLIVSNPPYFQNSLKCTDKSKTISRHNTDLSFEDLIKGSINILSPNGSLCIIIPYDLYQKVCILSNSMGLNVRNVLYIHTKKNAPPKRCIMQLSRTFCKTVYNEFHVHGDGLKGYSNQYLELTKDYHNFI